MSVLLFSLWLILNAQVTLEIVILGIVLVALVLLAMTRLTDYSFKGELKIWSKVPLAIAYVFVLIWEILKANKTVARIILDRRVKVEQTVVYVDIDLKTDFCKMIMANSITLTPGTMTASVDGNTFTVHCLSREMLDGIETSTFARLLQRLEA
ncbi:MAG: sodium:proton antiporter [Ruminococcaceae bacterium]|nr:sodium:proton antiporter [Oscillospiraceae bacterium]